MPLFLHRMAVGFILSAISWGAAAAPTSLPDVSTLYRQAVRAAAGRPDKAFWYSFAAPEKEGLRFDPGLQKGKLEALAGPWKGRSAVHLFHGVLTGEPFAFAPDATVVFWLRVHGWEKVDRNGYKRTNGGVMAVGSGWYGGWRIVVTPASGTVSFSLGSSPDDVKAPRVSLSAPGCLTLDRWHHLAIVRAGTMLRLYVDGNQQAEREVSAPYTAPSKAPCKARTPPVPPADFHPHRDAASCRHEQSPGDASGPGSDNPGPTEKPAGLLRHPGCFPGKTTPCPKRV